MKGEARAAAEILRAILKRIERGELTAAGRVRARLDGLRRRSRLLRSKRGVRVKPEREKTRDHLLARGCQSETSALRRIPMIARRPSPARRTYGA
jgi:hypothetical protein